VVIAGCQSSISGILLNAADVCVECQVVELPALRLTFVHSVAETSRLEQIRLLLPAGNDGVSVAKADILGTEVNLAESQGVPVAQGGETAAKGSLAGTGESAGIARLLSQALNQVIHSYMGKTPSFRRPKASSCGAIFSSQLSCARQHMSTSRSVPRSS